MKRKAGRTRRSYIVSSGLVATAEATARRTRLTVLCTELPEVVRLSTGQHVAFKVGKRTFAYYLFDHHGDGCIALCCKTPRGAQRKHVQRDSERFFVPPYLGASGWVGLRLDLDEPSWDEVKDLVWTSYRMVAPKRLALFAV